MELLSLEQQSYAIGSARRSSLTSISLQGYPKSLYRLPNAVTTVVGQAQPLLVCCAPSQPPQPLGRPRRQPLNPEHVETYEAYDSHSIGLGSCDEHELMMLLEGRVPGSRGSAAPLGSPAGAAPASRAAASMYPSSARRGISTSPTAKSNARRSKRGRLAPPLPAVQSDVAGSLVQESRSGGGPRSRGGRGREVLTATQTAARLLRLAELQGPLLDPVARAMGPDVDTAAGGHGPTGSEGSYARPVRAAPVRETKLGGSNAGGPGVTGGASEAGADGELGGTGGSEGTAACEAEADGKALEGAMRRLLPLLPHMAFADLRAAMEALAAAGHVPPDTWAHDLLAASEQRMEEAQGSHPQQQQQQQARVHPPPDATEVYGMLAALARLRLRPARPQWAAAACCVLGQQLQQLAPEQVVDMLSCLATLALQPPEQLLRRAFALLLPDVESRTTEQEHLDPLVGGGRRSTQQQQQQAAEQLGRVQLITQLLGACSKLRRTPPPHFMAAVYMALSHALAAGVQGSWGSGSTATPTSSMGGEYEDEAGQGEVALLCRLAAALAALKLDPPPPPALVAAMAARAEQLLAHTAELVDPGGAAAAAAAPAGTSTGGTPPATAATASPTGTGAPRRRSGGRGVRSEAAATEAARLPRARPRLFQPRPDGRSTLTAWQLSCLMRDLKALGAAASPAWGDLCGRVAVQSYVRHEPMSVLLYLLGAAARYGVAMPGWALEAVWARVEDSLRGVDTGAGGSGGVHDGIARLSAAATGEQGPGSGKAAHEPGAASRDGLARGAKNGEDEQPQASEGTAAADAAGEWTPQLLSTAAVALVPYARTLPPTLLLALYDRLSAALPYMDLPELTSTLHALPTLAQQPSSSSYSQPSPPTANRQPPPPPGLLASYLACLLGRMRRMQPWQLSMCLHALQRLGVRPDPPWMDELLGLSYRIMPSLDELQLYGVLRNVALMGYRPSAQWMHRALTCAAGRLSCFSPKHLSQLLWAVATVGYRPPAPWTARALAKARDHFRTSDARTLSGLAWAVAAMGHRPDDVWLRDFCDHFAARLRFASPQGAATTLWALARLDHRPAPAWLHALERHTLPLLHAAAVAQPTRRGPATPRDTAPGSTAPGAPASCNLQDIAQLLYSFARMGHTLSDDWLTAAATAASHLAQLGPAHHASPGPGRAFPSRGPSVSPASAAAHAHNISLILSALARFRRSPSLAAWYGILEGLYGALPYASPQSLAVLLHAAAQLQLPLPREHAGAMLLATHRHMAAGDFTPGGLAMAVKGLVVLGVEPGSRWMAAVEHEVRQMALEAAAAAEVELEKGEEGEEQQGGVEQLVPVKGCRPEVRELGRLGRLPVRGEGRAAKRRGASAWARHRVGIVGSEVDTRDHGDRGEDEDAEVADAGVAVGLGPRERCALLWAVTTLETCQPAADGTGAYTTALVAGPSANGSSSSSYSGNGSGGGQRVLVPRSVARRERSPARGEGGALVQPLPQAQAQRVVGGQQQVAVPVGQDGPVPVPRWVPRARDLAVDRGEGDGGGLCHGRLLGLLLPPRWQLPLCSGKDLAAVCAALGRLRCRPSGEYLHALLQEVGGRLEEQRQGQWRQGTTPTPGSAGSEPGSGSGAGEPEAGARHEGASTGGNAGGGGERRYLGPSDLAVAAWGLSCIGVWPHASWRAAVAGAAAAQLAAGLLGPREAATVLLAMARWARVPAALQRQREWARQRRQQQQGQQQASHAVVGASGPSGGSRDSVKQRDGREGRQGRGLRVAARRLRLAVLHARLQRLQLRLMRRGGRAEDRNQSRNQVGGPQQKQKHSRLRLGGRSDWRPRMYSAARGESASTRLMRRRTAHLASLALSHSAANANEYTPRALCNLLWALSALGVRALPPAWVQAWMPGRLLRCLQLLPPDHRVVLLHALGRLGLRPGAGWLERAEAVAMEGLRTAGRYMGLQRAVEMMTGGRVEPG